VKAAFATRIEARAGRAMSPSEIFAVASKRETALSHLLMAYIGTGLVFMLLPGTFLGVWNLISISSHKAAEAISPAWIQAHGQAQVFGWIGSFILGIGFYSIPKLRQLQPFAMARGWTCWGMWTSGVALRWVAGVYLVYWRVLLPVSGLLQLLAFAIFFVTVSGHRPSSGSSRRLDSWIIVVITGTIGLLAVLCMNVGESIVLARTASSPAFNPTFDQSFLVVMTWGFMVPFVWGFSARWLQTFIGLRPACPRGLMLLIAVNTMAIIMAMFGLIRIAAVLFVTAGIMSLLAIRVAFPSIRPAKTQGVHSSFPLFVRIAYGWLLVAALLGLWAASRGHSEGIWGASRHALTVGFVATMVFAVGQRILPAFSGMRLLYSTKVMGASLILLAIGCLARVTSEILAYQGIWLHAWKCLPVSAVIELTAVTLFAINMIATFLSRPPSERLLQIK
jgi:uncharacterized protein involved in response to NO